MGALAAGVVVVGWMVLLLCFLLRLPPALFRPLGSTMSAAVEVDLLQVITSPWEMRRHGFVGVDAVVAEEAVVVIEVIGVDVDGVGDEQVPCRLCQYQNEG